ncbi:MAG: hypothetical protein WDA00_02055 [Eubacteriales bacterium]
MRKVYILLSRTRTIASRTVHLFTRGRFTHVSIALEPSTEKFWSYARRSLHNPFSGGLMKENTKTFIFGRYGEMKCALLSLQVSDEAYQKIAQRLYDMVINFDKCKYSIRGLPLALLRIQHDSLFRFNCAHFVAHLLKLSDAVPLPKHPSLMRPMDFLKLSGIRLLYEGTLGECAFPSLEVERGRVLGCM